MIMMKICLFNMKKIYLILASVVLSFLAVGCAPTPQTSDQILNKQQEQLQKESVAQIGVPAIKNFQEKKLAKMIYELRDTENVITYAYLLNSMTGKPVYLGRAIGFGLPYSVQYTSPMKVEDICTRTGYCPTPIPQADPNGLFMPEGLSATWVMLLDEKGEPHPTYIESDVIISVFPLIN